MKYTVVLMLALVVGGNAFQNWKGFRFGAFGGNGDSRDLAFAVGQIPSGNFLVAGGIDDSACCKWDSIGQFYSDGSYSGGVPWLEQLDTSGQNLGESLVWGYLRGGNGVRWYDLMRSPYSGYFTAGSIGDTVLFTGTERVSRYGVTPDTFDATNLREVIRRGGGGGIGIGRWTDSGQLAQLHLLRFQFPVWQDAGMTIGWQIHLEKEWISVSGTLAADSAGQLWEGSDSFPVPAGNSCFVYSMDTSSSNKWFATTSCIQWLPSEHIVFGGTIWSTATDTFSGPRSSTGNPYYRGWRPGLLKLDASTGQIFERVHPMGAMQGMARALAVHENGSMLLVGEQSGTLQWNGRNLDAILDSSTGLTGYKLPVSSFFALLDTSGSLRAFKQLHGLDNAGGWKVRRIPGKGWLALTWDEKDVLGWSRLYLFDDSLNLLDSSDRVPEAMDVELGIDGRILVSGRSRSADSTATWLKGEGSMWVASCWLGPSRTTRLLAQASKSKLAMWQMGKNLKFELSGSPDGLLEIFGLDGGVRFHGQVNSATVVELPDGVSMCRLVTKNGIQTGHFTRL